MKQQQSPREESFIQMVKYSIFPLLRRGSFTFWISLMDCLLYFGSLIVQYDQLRPNQRILYYVGQLYPYFIQQHLHIHRLFLGVELFKNEIHLFVIVLLKLHFYSYVEYQIHTKKLVFLYLLSTLSSTLFQCIMSIQPGVCGTFPIGIVLTALLLQQQQLKKASHSEQLHYYYDYQQSQDIISVLLKTSAVLLVCFILSIKDQGILFSGTFMFMLQSCLISQYLTHKENQSKVKQTGIQYQTQPTRKQQNDHPERQINKLFWLFSSLFILFILTVIFCLKKQNIIS